MNPFVTERFPSQRASMRKMFPYHHATSYHATYTAPFSLYFISCGQVPNDFTHTLQGYFTIAGDNHTMAFVSVNWFEYMWCRESTDKSFYNHDKTKDNNANNYTRPVPFNNVTVLLRHNMDAFFCYHGSISHYLHFLRGIHRWFPSQRASYAEHCMHKLLNKR